MKQQSKLISKHRRLNHLYKIIDKNGQEVTFRMNEAQTQLWHKTESMKQAGKKKLIILKARQLGFSTYKLIEGLDRALFSPNQTCIITAHKQEKLNDLFKKVKFAYEKLPPAIKMEDGSIWTKPKPVYDNTSEYQFDNNSRIKITMDSRSLTPTFLHITELAFVTNAEDMMTGTLPSLPESATLTIETTANGVGNYFHKIRKQNEYGGEYETLFIPRYTDKLYTSSEGGQGYAEEHVKTVRLLFSQGKITKEQMNWYEKKASELGREVIQEYPSTPEEAFLTTGNPVFDLSIIGNVKKPEYTVHEVWKDLRIYKKAEKTVFYGVDTSLGNGGDYSTIVVRDREMNLYASYRGYIPPDQICNIIDRLRDNGYKGKIGIENNNTGIATITEAMKRKRYMFLYREKAVDTVTNREKYVYGWNTNTKTRPVMISDMEKNIRIGNVKEMDEREVTECYTFIYNDNMKPEAMIGCHDDMVMADAICQQMIARG